MESDHILTRSYPLPEGVNQSVTKITSHYGEKKFKHDKSIAFFKPSRMVCYMIGFELKKNWGRRWDRTHYFSFSEQPKGSFDNGNFVSDWTN